MLAVSMMMLISIKQYLGRIWSSIHENVQQNWRWVEKTRCLWKKGVYHHFLKVTSAKKFSYRKYSLNWRFFLFHYAQFSRYSMFCISNHSMNCKVSDAMASICTWDRVHFVTYLLYHESLGHDPWPTSRYSYGQCL